MATNHSHELPGLLESGRRYATHWRDTDVPTAMGMYIEFESSRSEAEPVSVREQGVRRLARDREEANRTGASGPQRVFPLYFDGPKGETIVVDLSESGTIVGLEIVL